MSPLNKYELARELGIAVRSVERYQHRGCPFSHDDENRTVFDIEGLDLMGEPAGELPGHMTRGGGDRRAAGAADGGIERVHDLGRRQRRRDLGHAC